MKGLHICKKIIKGLSIFVITFLQYEITCRPSYTFQVFSFQFQSKYPFYQAESFHPLVIRQKFDREPKTSPRKFFIRTHFLTFEYKEKEDMTSLVSHKRDWSPDVVVVLPLIAVPHYLPKHFHFYSVQK